MFLLLASCSPDWPEVAEPGTATLARSNWSGAIQLVDDADVDIHQFGTAGSDVAWTVDATSPTDVWIAGSTEEDAFVCDQATCPGFTGHVFGSPSASDEVQTVLEDGSDVVLVGTTRDGGTVGAPCTTNGGWDGFYARIDQGTGALGACEQFATSRKEEGVDLGSDGTHVFVAVRGMAGVGSPPEDADVVIRVYDLATSAYLTEFVISTDGANPIFDEPMAIRVVPRPRRDETWVYVAGLTDGDMANAGFTDNFGSDPGDWDPFVAKLTFDTTNLTFTADWQWQFGTNGQDGALGLSFKHGSLAVVGRFAEQTADITCQGAATPDPQFSDVFTTWFDLDSDGNPYSPWSDPPILVHGDCATGDVATGVMVAAADRVGVIGTMYGYLDHAECYDDPNDPSDAYDLDPQYCHAAEDAFLLVFPIVAGALDTPDLYTIRGINVDDSDRALGMAASDRVLSIVGSTESDLDGTSAPGLEPDAFWVQIRNLP